MKGAFSFAFECIAAVLAPPCCAGCDAPVSILSVFCDVCASTVQTARADAGMNGVVAFAYGGAVARAIVRFKYERRPDLARPLGDLLWRAVASRAAAFASAVVVPVPLHASRLAERGFNQSALLAARVATHLGVSQRPMALARIRDTPKQAALGRSERLGNLRGAFVVRSPVQVRRRSVLLVDDVRTTGATLEACTTTLLEAGAASVTFAVVAAAE